MQNGSDELVKSNWRGRRREEREEYWASEGEKEELQLEEERERKQW